MSIGKPQQNRSPIVKVNLRSMICAVAITFAVVLFVVPTLAVASQWRESEQQRRGHDKGDDGDRNLTSNQNYQHGWNQGHADGVNDRAHQYRSHPDNDNDRRAYEMGYDEGYQSTSNRGGIDRDRDRHDGNGRNQSPGYQAGFRDGSTDGRNDRMKNRNPKYGLGYKHPDRQYNSSFGDKRAYEQQYREAYGLAYQQSYNGRARDHNER